MVTLMKKAEKKGTPLHELKILHLGVQAKVKAHDMTAEAYLRRISVRCFDFPGKCRGPSVGRRCRSHNQHKYRAAFCSSTYRVYSLHTQMGMVK